jgi:hypothetical protein
VLQVDAHLSYDTRATVDKALRLVDLYAEKGVDPSRLYIKVRLCVCARVCVGGWVGVGGVGWEGVRIMQTSSGPSWNRGA